MQNQAQNPTTLVDVRVHKANRSFKQFGPIIDSDQLTLIPKSEQGYNGSVFVPVNHCGQERPAFQWDDLYGRHH